MNEGAGVNIANTATSSSKLGNGTFTSDFGVPTWGVVAGVTCPTFTKANQDYISVTISAGNIDFSNGFVMCGYAYYANVAFSWQPFFMLVGNLLNLISSGKYWNSLDLFLYENFLADRKTGIAPVAWQWVSLEIESGAPGAAVDANFYVNNVNIGTTVATLQVPLLERYTTSFGKCDAPGMMGVTDYLGGALKYWRLYKRKFVNAAERTAIFNTERAEFGL